MNRRQLTGLGGLAALALGGGAWWLRRDAARAAFDAVYARPLPPPAGPVDCYHLGHSLVGRDMPAMLAELGGHRWNSQLGWGASLKDHWRGEVPGLAEENRPPAYRPAREALDSGDYPVVVLTEMVELRDAIRWHDSADYLGRWAALARRARPDVRVCLYETWHRQDDPEGWEARIAADRARLWEDRLLRPAVAAAGPIHVIPGGQVMLAVAQAAAAGRIPGVSGREALFADEIHFNDLGAWLMAVTHHAVIYGRDPAGLPGALHRADGSPATPVPPETAAAMQDVVWRVVSGYALTGVADAG
ncbi:MAG: hypothetical protein R3D63_12240 [Paracoccaceae bacterium]